MGTTGTIDWDQQEERRTTRREQTRFPGKEETGTHKKKEGRFNPSCKVYMRQQRSVMAFVPRSTVHIHYNPWRILGVKNIYFRGDEIFKFENKAMKHKKQNNIETNKTKIEKYLTDRKLGIEFKSGKQASCAHTYLTKGNTKQRTI